MNEMSMEEFGALVDGICKECEGIKEDLSKRGYDRLLWNRNIIHIYVQSHPDAEYSVLEFIVKK